jgi:hypothetical protein
MVRRIPAHDGRLAIEIGIWVLLAIFSALVVGSIVLIFVPQWNPVL